MRLSFYLRERSLGLEITVLRAQGNCLSCHCMVTEVSFGLATEKSHVESLIYLRIVKDGLLFIPAYEHSLFYIFLQK